MKLNYESGCRLPLELLRTVLEHIHSPSSLLPVALASSVLREEAQRILFMAPTLPNAFSHLIFLTTIIASPTRLGPLVKTYTQFGVLYPYATWELRQTLRERTAAALKVMVNLKKLGYRITGSEHSAEILRSCTFQLSALAWVCYGDDMQVLLREILPQQRGIKHLSLLGSGALSSDDIQTAKSLCPTLSSLEGPVSVFPAFLAGRKIRHLQWTLDSDNGADVDLALLPAELQDVESLVFGAYEDFPLQSIINHLRSVKFLKISCHEARFDGFPKLPNLCNLLLSDYADSSPIAAASRLDSVATAFRHYKALEYVDWQDGPESYIRYTVVNLDTSEFNATPVNQDEVLPWKDQECFGFY